MKKVVIIQPSLRKESFTHLLCTTFAHCLHWNAVRSTTFVFVPQQLGSQGNGPVRWRSVFLRNPLHQFMQSRRLRLKRWRCRLHVVSRKDKCLCKQSPKIHSDDVKPVGRFWSLGSHHFWLLFLCFWFSSCRFSISSVGSAWVLICVIRNVWLCFAVWLLISSFSLAFMKFARLFHWPLSISTVKERHNPRQHTICVLTNVGCW